MNSVSFGEAAARLCGATALLLGWRPAEFWDSTPVEVETALRHPMDGCELPDAETIDALRRRFPDG